MEEEEVEKEEKEEEEEGIEKSVTEKPGRQIWARQNLHTGAHLGHT